MKYFALNEVSGHLIVRNWFQAKYFGNADNTFQEIRVSLIRKASVCLLEKVSMANLSNCTTPLGSFSSLCFKKTEAIYLSFVNVCDLPYSVTIFVIDTARSLEVKKKLTRIDEGSYLHVKGRHNFNMKKIFWCLVES